MRLQGCAGPSRARRTSALKCAAGSSPTCSLPIATAPPARPPQVTIFGKRPADAGWSTVASVAQGINWKAADWVRLVIYPQENEWPALAVKSGVK